MRRSDSVFEEKANRLCNRLWIVYVKMMSSREEDILQIRYVLAACPHSLLPVRIFLEVKVPMNQQSGAANLLQKLNDLFL